MKITLIVLLLNVGYNVTYSSSTSNNVTSYNNSPGTTFSSNNTNNTKIKIPMPDLKSCLDARKQFDDNSNVVISVCSAE